MAAGATATVNLRLTATAPSKSFKPFGADFTSTVAARRAEADAFYSMIIPSSLNADQTMVMHQALAGMLWTKQYYFFDLDKWLEERSANPLTGGKQHSRNRDWIHMLNGHVISMPDKWSARPSCAASSPACSTKSASSAPTASGRCHAGTSSTRMWSNAHLRQAHPGRYARA